MEFNHCNSRDLVLFESVLLRHLATTNSGCEPRKDNKLICTRKNAWPSAHQNRKDLDEIRSPILTTRSMNTAGSHYISRR